MPSSQKMQRDRFFPKCIEVNVDGHYELWELDRHDILGKDMTITYKLKKKGEYSTGV